LKFVKPKIAPHLVRSSSSCRPPTGRIGTPHIGSEATVTDRAGGEHGVYLADGVLKQVQHDVLFDERHHLTSQISHLISKKKLLLQL
jgi:hypothetical protein